MKIPNNDKFKIDFVGIGFPKSGSTWLYENLKNHKQITIAKNKETDYFIRDFTHINPVIKSIRKINDFDSYKKQFDNQEDSTVIKGEFSVNYVFDPTVVDNLFKHNKNIKILICIRNPIDYIYSSYMFDKNSYIGHNISDNFREALNKSTRKDWYHIEKGYFYKWVHPYFSKFSGQIHVITLNEIKNNPYQTLKNVCRFLNIDSSENYLKEIIISKRVNQNKKYRNKYINKIIFFIIELSKKFHLFKLLKYLIQIDSFLLKFITKYLKVESSYQKINIDDKKYLYNIYKNDIDNLEKLIKKDLSSWK